MAPELQVPDSSPCVSVPEDLLCSAWQMGETADMSKKLLPLHGVTVFHGGEEEALPVACSVILHVQPVCGWRILPFVLAKL